MKNIITNNDKLSKNIEEADNLTLSVFNPYAKKKKQHYQKGAFYMTAKKFDELLIAEDFTKTEMKVLAYLRLNILAKNEIKSFKLSNARASINISEANICRALQELVKKEIIFKLKDGNYKFNDKYIYSGK